MNAMKHGNVLHFCLRNGVPPSAAPASLPPVCPRLPRAVTSRLHSSCCCSGNTIPWRGLSPAGLTLTAAHAGCPPLTTDFISENFPADVWKSMDVQATEVAAADSAFIGSKVRCRRRTSPPAAASQHHRPSPCRCLAARAAASQHHWPSPRRCLAARSPTRCLAAAPVPVLCQSILHDRCILPAGRRRRWQRALIRSFPRKRQCPQVEGRCSNALLGWCRWPRLWPRTTSASPECSWSTKSFRSSSLPSAAPRPPLRLVIPRRRPHSAAHCLPPADSAASPPLPTAPAAAAAAAAGPRSLRCSAHRRVCA